MYILLVEADHSYAKNLLSNLSKEGFNQVKHIDNGIDCLLQVYEDATPDLVIMDSRLERINGVDVLQKLVTHKSGIRVIMLSNSANGIHSPKEVNDCLLDVVARDNQVIDHLMPHIHYIHSELNHSRKNRPVNSLLVNLKRFIFAP